MALIDYILGKGKDHLWRILGEEGIELVLKDSNGFDLKPNQNICYAGMSRENGVPYANSWSTAVGCTFYEKTPTLFLQHHRRIKKR